MRQHIPDALIVCRVHADLVALPSHLLVGERVLVDRPADRVHQRIEDLALERLQARPAQDVAAPHPSISVLQDVARSARIRTLRMATSSGVRADASRLRSWSIGTRHVLSCRTWTIRALAVLGSTLAGFCTIWRKGGAKNRWAGELQPDQA